MAEPIPLSAYNISNPFEQIQRLTTQQLVLDASRQQLEQQRLQAEQQAAQQNDLSNLANLVSAGKARPEDYLTIMTKHPTLAAGIKTGWDAMTSKQRDAEATFGLNIVNALQNNQPDIATKLLQERADAFRNSGQEQKAKEMEDVMQMVNINPNAALMTGNMWLSQGLGAEKFLELQSKSAKGESDLPASIREAIAVGQLNPEQRKTFEDLQKLKNPSTTVNVDTGKASSKVIGEKIPTAYDNVLASRDTMQSIERMENAVDKAIVGFGAKERIYTARVANALGFTGDSSITNTREVIKGMAEIAVKARSQLGSQAQISNSEQELLTRAVSGDETLTTEEIKTVLGIAKRTSKLIEDRNIKFLEKFAPSDPMAEKLRALLNEEQSTLPPPPGSAPPMPPSAGLPPPPLGTPPGAGAAQPGLQLPPLPKGFKRIQ